MRITSRVAGHAVAGHVQLSRAEVKPTGRTITQETVWFEDDAPADAEIVGQWRWVTDPVYSGYRAHAPGWQRQPYGFDTRLSKLDVPAGASLFLYVSVDPEEPPLRLAVSVTHGEGVYQLIWGEGGQETGDRGQRRVPEFSI